ncbi:uncharacterized protein LOC124159717 [Ischnura elegans]|uniref:uncharacterized protein LOC124159717 n=1 Tax=Ischnura elegans TaxID=197161 RepID=UPI001ED8709C|nr:uncharacterized protein LOC124159717 [Ischnura elegans]
MLSFNRFTAPLLSGTLRTYQRAGCEGEQVILRCPPGTSISVQVAQYGRPPVTSPSHHSIVSSSTLYKPPPLCPGGNAPPNHAVNTTCHWPSALQYSLLQTVVEACQKKPHCKFQVTAKALGGAAAAVEDICPGSSKFVEVAYKCRPFEFRSKVACEDEAAELKCGSHARIAVYSASFGRTEYESIQCPQPQGVPEETCLVSYATETAMQMCHGKRKCILNANAATFGNPCKQESRMYLKIVYTCVPRKVLKERYEEKTEDGDWGQGDDDEDEEEDPSRANEEYDSYGGNDEDLFRESSPFSPPPLRPDDEDGEFGGGPGKAQPSLVGKAVPGGPTPRPHSKGGSLPAQSGAEVDRHAVIGSTQYPYLRRRTGAGGAHTSKPQVAVLRSPRPRLQLRSSTTQPTPPLPPLTSSYLVTDRPPQEEEEERDQESDEEMLREGESGGGSPDDVQGDRGGWPPPPEYPRSSSSSPDEVLPSPPFPSSSPPDPSVVTIVNCTVTVLTERNHVIGFITEWIHAYHFLSRNREKLYLYVCVSVGGGLVVLLSAVAGRLYLSRRRENRRMRRRGVGRGGGQGHSSSSGGGSGGDEGNSGGDSSTGARGGVTLPNGFLAAEDVDMMSEIDADIDLMVATTSPRPPPPSQQPVQIVSSADGEVLGVSGPGGVVSMQPIGGGGGHPPPPPGGGGGRTPVPPPFVPPSHVPQPPVGQVVRYGHPRAGGSVLGVRRQDSDTNPRSLSRSGNNQYYYA